MPHGPIQWGGRGDGGKGGGLPWHGQVGGPGARAVASCWKRACVPRPCARGMPGDTCRGRAPEMCARALQEQTPPAVVPRRCSGETI